MSEVLDEICQILTEPKFMGKMVVILAGYEQQIEELLAINPGLKSRFSEQLMFPSFTAAETQQLLVQQLDKRYGLQLSEEADTALPGLVEQVGTAPAQQRHSLKRLTLAASPQSRLQHCFTDLTRATRGFASSCQPLRKPIVTPVC